MRDIKRRKGSIESTQQITKAMKLVSTVKLQRAKARAEQSKFYFNQIYDTVTSILAKAQSIEHPHEFRPVALCTAHFLFIDSFAPILP